MNQESVFKNKAVLAAVAMLAIVALGGGILLSEDSDAASTVKVTLVVSATENEVLEMPKGDMFTNYMDSSEKYDQHEQSNFLGWYCDEDYKTPFLPNSIINKDITIYAKWYDTTTQKVIRLYDDGVTGVADLMGTSIYIIDNIVVENGTKALKPTDPTKAGYKFVGWYELVWVVEEGVGHFEYDEYDWNTAVTANVLLAAGWEKSDFNVPGMDANILFWVFLVIAILMFVGAIFTKSFGVGMLGIFMCVLACVIYFGVIDMLMDAFKGLMPSS